MVYAESKDGSVTSEKIRIIVRKEIPVERITLSQADADLALGETVQIFAEITPANADKPFVSWTSDNRDVASVDWDGHVYAVSEGTATVTAASMNGVSSSVIVTVDGTKRFMLVSTSLPENEDDGSEWNITTEINGEPVGQECILSVGDTLDFHIECTGSGENPIRCETTASHAVTEEDFLNGFSVSIDLSDSENYGEQRTPAVVRYDFSIPKEKVYTWERDLAEPDENDQKGLLVFNVCLYPNGTFQYMVRSGSDHIGSGHWTKSGDTITLMEDTAGFDRIFYFIDRGDRLVFLREGSDVFGGADVEDGDSFLYREEYEDL